jgi:hypothetical protein
MWEIFLQGHILSTAGDALRADKKPWTSHKQSSKWHPKGIERKMHSWSTIL